VLEAHEELGEAMKGIDVRQLEEKDMLSTRLVVYESRSSMAEGIAVWSMQT